MFGGDYYLLSPWNKAQYCHCDYS